MAVLVSDPIPAASAKAVYESALSAVSRQDWDLADRRYLQLSKLIPHDYRILVNRAQVSWYADRPELARRLYAEANEIARDTPGSDPLPLQGLGNALRDLNRFEEADQAYQDCRSLPDAPPLAAWNHSQLLMGLERYEEAFALAEERLPLPECPVYRDPAQSYWDGDSRPDRLHVWSEQGFGDTLQYLRWCLPLLSQQRVVLELESPLLSLVRDGLEADVEVVAKSDSPPRLPAADAHVSLLSLPHRLGLDPLLKPAGPYLGSDAWPARSHGAAPRVGLVWAAGRSQDDPFTAREYKKRSLTTHVLASLIQGLHQQGAELIPLQVGPDHTAVRAWSHCFASDGIPQTSSFAENARWIRDLDLLISVDTASAHLAGALGHPCWLLLPFSADPRWLRDRSDSPWYPSFRLFRQPSSGQWLPVVDDVLQAFSPWWQSISGS